MAILKDILYGVSLKQVVGSTDVEVQHLQLDSRKVSSGDCFIAVKGSALDGHAFIEQCIEKGAIAIVCEELPATTKPGVTYVKVQHAG